VLVHPVTTKEYEPPVTRFEYVTGETVVYAGEVSGFMTVDTP
jgi:hypothetical protein